MKKLATLLIFIPLHLYAMQDIADKFKQIKEGFLFGGDTEYARALLKKIPLDCADEDGRTPLFYAVMSNCIELIEEMIANGANVNVKDNYGDTPLHYAAWWSHSKIVRQLLDAKALVNAKNDDGATPLLNAVKLYKGTENNSVIEELITAGADTNLSL